MGAINVCGVGTLSVLGVSSFPNHSPYLHKGDASWRSVARDAPVVLVDTTVNVVGVLFCRSLGVGYSTELSLSVQKQGGLAGILAGLLGCSYSLQSRDKISRQGSRAVSF